MRQTLIWRLTVLLNLFYLLCMQPALFPFRYLKAHSFNDFLSFLLFSFTNGLGEVCKLYLDDDCHCYFDIPLCTDEFVYRACVYIATRIYAAHLPILTSVAKNIACSFCNISTIQCENNTPNDLKKCQHHGENDKNKYTYWKKKTDEKCKTQTNKCDWTTKKKQ